jgi:hypothetical protein
MEDKPMDLAEIQDNLIGKWTGKKLLRLSHLTCSPEGMEELAVQADYTRIA